jgi:RNA polymerase sigma-70 factor (ECF subfamily)
MRRGARCDTPPDDPEAALLTSAASGDQQAMADLYDTYAGALYGYGYRRLGSTTLAEDLVQRVMTRLWQLADRYDPSRASVRTWVFTIARTSCIDLHRAQPPAAATGDVPEAPGPLVEGIDAELERLLHGELIRGALELLSADHRQVIDLCYFAGLSQVEVAARLDLPLGTVKSRSFYAMKALRLTLEELGVQP